MCQAGLSTFQSGPKGTKMVNLNVFDHLGPILGPSGPFWTILDKNDFFAPNGQSRVWGRCSGVKNQSLFDYEHSHYLCNLAKILAFDPSPIQTSEDKRF